MVQIKRMKLLRHAIQSVFAETEHALRGAEGLIGVKSPVQRIRMQSGSDPELGIKIFFYDFRMIS